MIGYETDLLAVRRELIGDSTPNHEYQRIIARSQIRVSLRLCIEKDKVIASAIIIARPMTVEQLVGDMRLYRSLLLFLHLIYHYKMLKLFVYYNMSNNMCE